MGRSGIGKLARFLLGSCSEYCMENANCNVLVVKAEYTANDIPLCLKPSIEENQQKHEKAKDTSTLNPYLEKFSPPVSPATET